MKFPKITLLLFWCIIGICSCQPTDPYKAFKNLNRVETEVKKLQTELKAENYEMTVLDIDVSTNEKTSVLRFSFQNSKLDVSDPIISNQFRKFLEVVYEELHDKNEYDIFELSLNEKKSGDVILKQISKDNIFLE